MHVFWRFPKAQLNWRMGTSSVNPIKIPCPPSSFWFPVGHSCMCQQIVDQGQLSKYKCRRASCVGKKLLLPRCFEHWVLPVAKSRWHHGSFLWMRHSILEGGFYTRCRFFPCKVQVFSVFTDSASWEGSLPRLGFSGDSSCQLSLGEHRLAALDPHWYYSLLFVCLSVLFLLVVTSVEMQVKTNLLHTRDRKKRVNYFLATHW